MSCWDWFNLCKFMDIPDTQDSNTDDQTIEASNKSKKLEKSLKKQVTFSVPEDLPEIINSASKNNAQDTMACSKIQNRFNNNDHFEPESPQPGTSRDFYSSDNAASQELYSPSGHSQDYYLPATPEQFYSLPGSSVGFYKSLVPEFYSRPSTTQDHQSESLSQSFLKLKTNGEKKLFHYKTIMNEALSTRKSALTNTQLKKLHDRHKNTILTSFSNDYQSHPTLINAVNKSVLKLSTEIDREFLQFVKQHQDNLKQLELKALQGEAEIFYDMDMENFRPWEKSRPQVKSKHLDAIKGALEHFDHLVRLQQGSILNDQPLSIFRSSLKQRLDAKLPDFLLNCLTFNIGIYIDENRAIVGTINTENPNEIQVIQDLPAGIIFLEEEIKISDENPRHWNYFSVAQLLKTTESLLTVDLKTNKFLLTPDHILAIFFEKLVNLVKTTAFMQFIDNIVLVTPLTLASCHKKRIKNSAEMAGIPGIKIISSVLAAAVAAAVECDYYLNQETESKIIFVAQYQRRSFSMAAVEINPDLIAVAMCTGSDNMKECQTPNFFNGHERMFEVSGDFSNKSEEVERSENHQEIGLETSCLIKKMYQKAARRVFNYCGSANFNMTDCLIIQNLQNVPALDKVLIDSLTFVLNERSNEANDDVRNGLKIRSIKDGPLAGACFLASKSLPISLLPRNIQVFDSSRVNFILSVNSMKRRVDFINRVFVPELPAFQISSVSVPTEGSKVAITEEFTSGHEYEVGRWKLKAQIPTSIGVPQISLRGIVDPDGIISIDATFPPGVQGGKVFRLGPAESSHEKSCGLVDVKFYYESLIARQKHGYKTDVANGSEDPATITFK